MCKLYLLEKKVSYRFHIEKCKGLLLRILVDYEFLARS